MNRLFILAALICASLAGCATGPNFKTYTSSLPQPNQGESRIWFYRPSKIIGSAVQPVVYIDNMPIAKAQPGSFFYADRPPGTYELRCVTEWTDKTQLTISENKVIYVRLTLLPGVFIGHILPKVVPEDKALNEMQKCRLVTADGMNKDWKPPSAATMTNNPADLPIQNGATSPSPVTN